MYARKDITRDATSNKIGQLLKVQLMKTWETTTGSGG